MNKEVLKKVADKLNQLNCTWAIGGSVMLNHYDLIEHPNDIDILIDASYAKQIKEFMDGIGTYVALPSKYPFRTTEFFGYLVDDMMVEFLGDFKIELDDGRVYEFILDEHAIQEYLIVDGIKVNLTTLEDWFVAYGVMKDPKKRIPLLKQYFTEHGIKHKDLLERNVNNFLPISVKLEIENLFLQGK